MELRVGQIRIEAASSLQNLFLGKAHFRHQPVGVSAFFFSRWHRLVGDKMASCRALSCNFAAGVCPVFITYISFYQQHLHVRLRCLLIEVDDYFYQQL